MMMIFLFEFRNFSKSLPLLWMQEKLLQVWLSLLRCDWYIWWGQTCSTVHTWRSAGSTAESSASPLPPSLGFQVKHRPPGSDNMRFHTRAVALALSHLPSRDRVSAVVGLGNAGEPVLGCAWQCWSYSATGRTCFSMVAGDPDSGSHAWAVSASSMLPAPLTFCSDMDFLFYWKRHIIMYLPFEL